MGKTKRDDNSSVVLVKRKGTWTFRDQCYSWDLIREFTSDIDVVS